VRGGAMLARPAPARGEKVEMYPGTSRQCADRGGTSGSFWGFWPSGVVRCAAWSTVSVHVSLYLSVADGRSRGRSGSVRLAAALYRCAGRGRALTLYAQPSCGQGCGGAGSIW